MVLKAYYFKLLVVMVQSGRMTLEKHPSRKQLLVFMLVC